MCNAGLKAHSTPYGRSGQALLHPLSGQELPGFAIFFEAAVAAAMGRDAETDDGIEGLDGNDVPSFVRNDIGGKEVNVGRGVSAFYPAAGGSGDAVGSAVDNRDRFHLHPQEASASIQH